MDLASSTLQASMQTRQANAVDAQKQAVNDAVAGHRDAREVAEQFETVFVNTMIQGMFEGIKSDGPFGGGHGEEIYRSMLNEQYAEAITARGGIGLADSIYREILSLQEAK